MNTIERAARKQLLLTRIAYERLELRRDAAAVRDAAHLPALLRHAIGGKFANSLLGPAGPGVAGWVGTAMSLLRRYRVVATLLGGVAPVLRGRRGWRRLPMLIVLGAAGWFGWKLVQGRER